MKRQKLIEFRGNRTQSEMAKIYNISQQMWSCWETGFTTPPPYVMKQLEDDIGAPMEEIFYDVFRPPNVSKII